MEFIATKSYRVSCEKELRLILLIVIPLNKPPLCDNTDGLGSGPFFNGAGAGFSDERVALGRSTDGLVGATFSESVGAFLTGPRVFSLREVVPDSAGLVGRGLGFLVDIHRLLLSLIGMATLGFT